MPLDGLYTWPFHIFIPYFMMQIEARIQKRVFHFNFDAQTSRGRMKNKTSWFIQVWNKEAPGTIGIGECGPLPGLSPDDRPDFEEVLNDCVDQLGATVVGPDMPGKLVPPGFPSIRFGLETAWHDLTNGGRRIIFDNNFVRGTPIPINGLVWMGDMDQMLQQVSQRVAQGFRCLKLKVGGLNFEKECDILRYIRSKYYKENITIRLDANGAFKMDEVLYRLKELSKFNIHSIEQPIKPGLTDMAELCATSPIPVALDEELIGIESSAEKKKLLERIRPPFIILKPTLHGGFKSCKEWIALAEDAGTGWWITSALESNIGLNAVCQFTANYTVAMPQGLGTGLLYEDNVDSPLTVAGGEISYRAEKNWELGELATASPA
jgi:O-succinylbenzoate synthase